MNLLELKNKIEQLPKGTISQYGISEPFSWRGRYSEVAFSIEKAPTTRETMLERIEKAYTDVFDGYKGGTYSYDDLTPVNFESSASDWSDGDYTKDMIEQITGEYYCPDPDEELVRSICAKEAKQ